MLSPSAQETLGAIRDSGPRLRARSLQQALQHTGLVLILAQSRGSGSFFFFVTTRQRGRTDIALSPWAEALSQCDAFSGRRRR